MKCLYVAPVALFFSAGAGGSQGLSPIQLANSLATVIASEQPCNLTFDQAAIERWIDANVDPSDIAFGARLQSYTSGVAYNLRSVTGSALTAHCRVVANTARHFGFVR